MSLIKENSSKLKERTIGELARIESNKGYGYLQSEIKALPHKDLNNKWPEDEGLREYLFTKTIDEKDYVRVYKQRKDGQENFITLKSGDLFKAYKESEKKNN